MKKINVCIGPEEVIESNSHLSYYGMAFLLGLGILIGGILLLKGLGYVARLVFGYWTWVIGSIVVILILRKLLMKRRINVIQENVG